MVDIIFYDVEVFAYDWTVTFKSLRTGEYTFIHNNNYQVKEFMRQPGIILAGWNEKMYDSYMLLAIMAGADPQTLKRLNDWIIEDGRLPWEFPFLEGQWKEFDSFDLRDDLYKGLSLKEAEGNMRMNIEESSIPFDIDRPLTDEEVREVELYNKADVDATERVFHARKKNYLRPKVEVGKMIGLSGVESLRMTNGKLTAKVLNAEKRNWNDERQYKIPKNIKVDRLPREILEFYLRMYQDISDEELYSGPFENGKKIHVYFNGSDVVSKGKKLKENEMRELSITHEWYNGKLTIYRENAEYVYGFGGVHAGIANYVGEAANDKLLLLWDVRSLYPSIMIEYGFLSRNTPMAERFKEIYYERIEAKAKGNNVKSDSLKLVLNR